jgi:PAS domain S-box-containing protein
MSETQDMSTPVDAEHELRQAAARYEAILASTLDPVITIDFSGTIKSVSESVRRVFGWSPDELVGRNVTVLMPDPHRSEHDGYLARYRETGETWILGRTREFEALRKDGSFVPIELSVSRVDIPGEPSPLFTGIVHDITERREAERAIAQNEAELTRYREHLESLVEERTAQLESTHQQLRVAERLVSIGTLAAGIGHDMNNVLLPIRTRLDALDASELPSESAEHFDAVRKMIAYLQQLADGLRLLALDPNDPRASTETTDVRAWWQQVGSLLGRGVAKGTEFSAEWQPDLPNARIPPHRLTQAMLNLIVNAGEATGEGEHVRVWARLDENPGFVLVGVTDDGHGMPPEVLRHAQDPFFTTKKRGLGTGLGLSLAQSAARAAGGSLHIESEVDQGTTVSLRLPAASAEPAAAPVRRPVTAVVTVADARIESLVSTMLEAASVSVLDDGCLPDSLAGAGIWITEASPDHVATARAFLSRPRRRIVVLGDASAAWRDLGAVAVEQPTDVKTLRERLTSAIIECSGDLS